MVVLCVMFAPCHHVCARRTALKPAAVTPPLHHPYTSTRATPTTTHPSGAAPHSPGILDDRLVQIQCFT